MGIDVLNCRLGDLKLSFDKKNPVELERARRAVKKMLREGFVIFVEFDGKTRRVIDFDESCDSYVITDVPSDEKLPAEPDATKEPEIIANGKRGRPIGSGKRKLPAGSTKATAVAPRAGG